jgi:hypothetical protein
MKLYRTFREFNENADEGEILTAIIATRPAIGEFIIKNWIPEDGIRSSIASIRNAPFELTEKLTGQLKLFIQRLKRGDFSFSCFDDGFIPEYISSYIFDPDHDDIDSIEDLERLYRPVSELNTDEAIKEITAFVAAITEQFSCIKSMATTIVHGKCLIDEKGTLTEELFYMGQVINNELHTLD